MHSRVPGGKAAYSLRVSIAEDAHEPNRLMVVTPKDALQRALPLPSENDMAIEGLTAEEWEAFEQALAHR